MSFTHIITSATSMVQVFLDDMIKCYRMSKSISQPWCLTIICYGLKLKKKSTKLVDIYLCLLRHSSINMRSLNENAARLPCRLLESSHPGSQMLVAKSEGSPGQPPTPQNCPGRARRPWLPTFPGLPSSHSLARDLLSGSPRHIIEALSYAPS